jgi:hypothetical protein
VEREEEVVEELPEMDEVFEVVRTAKALYDYDAVEADELSIRKSLCSLACARAAHSSNPAARPAEAPAARATAAAARLGDCCPVRGGGHLH